MSGNSRTAQFRMNVAGTQADLRVFVASLKGRTPAEAMGMVAGSRLMRAMLISLGAQALLLVILTVSSALRSSDKPPATPAAQAPAAVPFAPDVSRGASDSPHNAANAAQGAAGAIPASASPAATKATPPADAAPKPRQPSMDTLDIDRLLD